MNAVMMTDLPEPINAAIDETTLFSVINQSNACLHCGLYIHSNELRNLSFETYINARRISTIGGKMLSCWQSQSKCVSFDIFMI